MELKLVSGKIINVSNLEIFSPTISKLMESQSNNIIEVPKFFTEKIVEMVTIYCDYHYNRDAGEPTFVDIFGTDVDGDTILKLIEASHYLKIRKLLDISCVRVSDMHKSMSADQFCDFLNIKEGQRKPKAFQSELDKLKLEVAKAEKRRVDLVEEGKRK